jgi:hypothetical protein
MTMRWLRARLRLIRWTIRALAGPRRTRGLGRPPAVADAFETLFEIYTFANDTALYDRMCQSFIDAGFSRGDLVRLSDRDDDPYAAITRIGQRSSARYPILCHQDVLADQGAGATQLLAALEQLDAIDPRWVVAGTAGVARGGRLVSRVADPSGGSFRPAEILPLPVVTLDGNFLAFNRRNTPRCSTGISSWSLYGSDVCLHALASSGSAYVIDFPVTHLSSGSPGRPGDPIFERSKSRFIAAWSERYWFLYVPTTVDVMFVSRSKILRRFFGSKYGIRLYW